MQAISEIGRAIAVQLQRHLQGTLRLEGKFCCREQIGQRVHHFVLVVLEAGPKNPLQLERDRRRDEKRLAFGDALADEPSRRGQLYFVV